MSILFNPFLPHFIPIEWHALKTQKKRNKNEHTRYCGYFALPILQSQIIKQ